MDHHGYMPGVGIPPPYNPHAPQAPEAPQAGKRVVHHHHYYAAPIDRPVHVRVERTSGASEFTSNLAVVALVVFIVGVIFDSPLLLAIGGICALWSLARYAREDSHGVRLIMEGTRDLLFSIARTLFVQWAYKKVICRVAPIHVRIG